MEHTLVLFQSVKLVITFFVPGNIQYIYLNYFNRNEVTDFVFG